MPFDFLLRLLSSLVAIAPLAAGYVLYRWYVGEPIDNRWLILSTATLLWSVLGFLPLLLFRRAGQDEPRQNRSNRMHRLPRPAGSEIQVEFYGSDRAPTIILTHGWGPDSTAWYYSKKVPQAELNVLSPGGHMVLMERNQLFADIVQTFSNSCLSLIRRV